MSADSDSSKCCVGPSSFTRRRNVVTSIWRKFWRNGGRGETKKEHDSAIFIDGDCFRTDAVSSKDGAFPIEVDHDMRE